MTDFMGGDDNPAKSACVLYNSDRINFFQSFVNDASSTDVCETFAQKFLKLVHKFFFLIFKFRKNFLIYAYWSINSFKIFDFRNLKIFYR